MQDQQLLAGIPLYLDSSVLLYRGCLHSLGEIELQFDSQGFEQLAGGVHPFLMLQLPGLVSRSLLLPCFSEKKDRYELVPTRVKAGWESWIVSTTYCDPTNYVLASNEDIVAATRWPNSIRSNWSDLDYDFDDFVSWFVELGLTPDRCLFRWTVPGVAVDRHLTTATCLPVPELHSRMRAIEAVEVLCNELRHFGVLKAVAAPAEFEAYFYRNGRRQWNALADPRSNAHLLAIHHRIRGDMNFLADREVRSDEIDAIRLERSAWSRVNRKK